MKFGPRKPSISKRVSARTTGKLKRTVKKSVNPTYGKKGMGIVNNPKKAVYNKVYNKTTFDSLTSVSQTKKRRRRKKVSNNSTKINSTNNSYGALTKFILVIAGIAILIYLFSIIAILAICALGIYLVYQFIFIDKKEQEAFEDTSEKRKLDTADEENNINDLKNWDDF